MSARCRVYNCNRWMLILFMILIAKFSFSQDLAAIGNLKAVKTRAGVKITWTWTGIVADDIKFLVTVKHTLGNIAAKFSAIELISSLADKTDKLYNLKRTKSYPGVYRFKMKVIGPRSESRESPYTPSLTVDAGRPSITYEISGESRAIKVTWLPLDPIPREGFIVVYACNLPKADVTYRASNDAVTHVHENTEPGCRYNVSLTANYGGQVKATSNTITLVIKPSRPTNQLRVKGKAIAVTITPGRGTRQRYGIGRLGNVAYVKANGNERVVYLTESLSAGTYAVTVWAESHGVMSDMASNVTLVRPFAPTITNFTRTGLQSCRVAWLMDGQLDHINIYLKSETDPRSKRVRTSKLRDFLDISDLRWASHYSVSMTSEENQIPSKMAKSDLKVITVPAVPDLKLDSVSTKSLIFYWNVYSPLDSLTLRNYAANIALKRIINPELTGNSSIDILTPGYQYRLILRSARYNLARYSAVVTVNMS